MRTQRKRSIYCYRGKEEEKRGEKRKEEKREKRKKEKRGKKRKEEKRGKRKIMDCLPTSRGLCWSSLEGGSLVRSPYFPWLEGWGEWKFLSLFFLYKCGGLWGWRFYECKKELVWTRNFRFISWAGDEGTCGVLQQHPGTGSWGWPETPPRCWAPSSNQHSPGDGSPANGGSDSGFWCSWGTLWSIASEPAWPSPSHLDWMIGVGHPTYRGSNKPKVFFFFLSEK